MGCDIHVYVERMNSDDVWEPVYTKLQPCSQCDGTTRMNAHCKNCEAEVSDHDEETKRCFVGPLTLQPTDEECDYCTKNWAPPGFEEDWHEAFYTGRNYQLFGILANVRATPDPEFTEERGVPEDCSQAYHYVSESPDWHSHTWYTLAELRKYPFQKKFPDFYRAMRRMSEVESDPTRIRMLMFFDN